jgi:NAD(P)-dependent dehydrogenase (short-subunit alcohol dehydrogenase family)
VKASEVVIVTGCHGAIGAAICERLLKTGLGVVGVDLRGDAEALDRPGFQFVHGDVTADATRTDAVASATAAGAPLVGLVNCAAVVPTGAALGITAAEWAATLSVNVYSAYFFAVTAADAMKPNGRGSIVNIGSIAGARPSPTNLAYGASKAALASVTASLAAALAVDGIRVNSIAPGLIDTPLTAEVDVRLAELAGVSTAEARSRRLAAIPVGRLGGADEVAAAVSFLLSDQASYITGQTLHVNGGSLMSV